MLSKGKKMVVAGCSVLTAAATGFLVYTFFIKPLVYCKVTFDSNGADNVTQNTWSVQVKKGEKVVEPLTMPHKNGFKFKFWTDNLRTEWSFVNRTVENDTTLVAKYNIINYEICLSPIYADLSDENFPGREKTYTIESETTVLPTLTPYASYSNYEFVTWKLNMSDYGEEDYVTVETLVSKGVDPEDIKEIPSGVFGNMRLDSVWKKIS